MAWEIEKENLEKQIFSLQGELDASKAECHRIVNTTLDNTNKECEKLKTQMEETVSKLAVKDQLIANLEKETQELIVNNKKLKIEVVNEHKRFHDCQAMFTEEKKKNADHAVSYKVLNGEI